MQPFRLLAVLAVVFLAARPAARAQTSRSSARPLVDLAIEQLVSGGQWKASRATGSYRAIVVRQGWEEVRRLVRLEWIQEAATPGPDSLRHALMLNDEANLYALSDPEFLHRGTHWILRLKAAAAPLAPYDQTIEFELGPPGKVSLVQRR